MCKPAVVKNVHVHAYVMEIFFPVVAYASLLIAFITRLFISGKNSMGAIVYQAFDNLSTVKVPK